MFEGSLVLWPAQRVTEGERVKETEENMYLGQLNPAYFYHPLMNRIE